MSFKETLTKLIQKFSTPKSAKNTKRRKLAFELSEMLSAVGFHSVQNVTEGGQVSYF